MRRQQQDEKYRVLAYTRVCIVHTLRSGAELSYTGLASLVCVSCLLTTSFETTLDYIGWSFHIFIDPRQPLRRPGANGNFQIHPIRWTKAKSAPELDSHPIAIPQTHVSGIPIVFSSPKSPTGLHAKAATGQRKEWQGNIWTLPVETQAVQV